MLAPGEEAAAGAKKGLADVGVVTAQNSRKRLVFVAAGGDEGRHEARGVDRGREVPDSVGGSSIREQIPCSVGRT